jgi:hypothetical protein
VPDATTDDTVEPFTSAANEGVVDVNDDVDSDDDDLARRPKRLSRTAKWIQAAATAANALRELQELQEQYAGWQGGLPENPQESAVAEKLSAVCDLDIVSALEIAQEAESLELPLGFGRD